MSEETHVGIYPLPYEVVKDRAFLEEHIYPNMQRNYYWSDDFSPHYYIAQAQAGFIAITDTFDDQELLLPEIQFSYALLDFNDLHISRHVKRLLRKREVQLHISSDIVPVAKAIQRYHKRCWLSDRYLQTLLATQAFDENFQLIAPSIRDNGKEVAGEIGYIIGNTYTSLSGFSSRDRYYRNYGTAQLVLLGEYLHANGFTFWNLGQSYMPYKFDLGAKQYDRSHFLKLWYDNI